MVKNLPSVQVMWVRSLDPEAPLEEETAPHSSILALENPMGKGAWRAAVHRTHRVGHYLATEQEQQQNAGSCSLKRFYDDCFK